MEPNKPLSPCVHSAVRSLPEDVTAWELTKYLLGIHPEYVTEEIRAVMPILDQSFEGDRKKIAEWLEEISERYPGENLLHSGLVIVGLLYVDPALNTLVPQEAITSIENKITFS